MEPFLTCVEFRSDSFPAYEGEEQEVNPNLWGKRLAEFLSSGLEAAGFRVGEIFSEDWGWVVPLQNESFPLRIDCGHYQEYPDGYLCFIEPHEPFVRRFLKKIDTRPRITELQQALDHLLTESEGIRDKHWWTYEQFLNPKRS